MGMEIARGVYLVDKAKGCNVYLLAGESLTLIDTGLPGNAGNIIKFIQAIGRNPGELSCIILTHSHFDHSGSLAALKAMTNARAVVHYNETVHAKSGGYTLSSNLISGRLFLRLLACFNPEKSGRIDCLVKDGEVLPNSGGIRVIHTPGHTPGSISLLLEKEHVLFVGDMIINNRDHLSRPLPFKSDKDQAENSLARLAALQFNICCFGHGPPLTSQAQEKVFQFAIRRPHTPVYWRLLRNWRRLIRFCLHLARKN
jgi:glyoxylase-like metal-dependent hydrolase (beta-lactamase superfamily II)